MWNGSSGGRMVEADSSAEFMGRLRPLGVDAGASTSL
jgi:hypothetical protein